MHLRHGLRYQAERDAKIMPKSGKNPDRLIRKKQMRRVVLYFLCVEILDILTTIIALNMGMVEINPLVNLGWDYLIGIKLMAILVVGASLQLKTEHRLDMLVVLVALSPVVWNCLQLILTW